MFSMSYELAVPAGDPAHSSIHAEITGYSVSLADGFENELLAYHWHPVGLSRVRTPHLHLGSFAAGSAISIGETHPPTGIVSLAAIVRFLIEDLEVEPNRPDWDRVLTEVEAAV